MDRTTQESIPTTAAPSPVETPPTGPLVAPPPTDPVTDIQLREKVEKAIGTAIGAEETRAEVVERVVRTVTAEFYRGPLPHPRHLQSYERICPGLADRIVAMAEKAHGRQEDRLDKAMKYEYEDRRTGLYLGFFALLALLLSGTIVMALGNSVVGGGLLGAAAIGTVIGTFVHGRRENTDESDDDESDADSTLPEKPGIVQRVSSLFTG